MVPYNTRYHKLRLVLYTLYRVLYRINTGIDNVVKLRMVRPCEKFRMNNEDMFAFKNKEEYYIYAAGSSSEHCFVKCENNSKARPL